MSEPDNPPEELQPLFELKFEPIDVPQGWVLALYRRGVYLKSLKPGRHLPLIDFQPATDTARFVYTTPARHEMIFKEVYSVERIPLDFVLGVEYGFDPTDVRPDEAARMIEMSAQERHQIVYDRVKHALEEVTGINPGRQILTNRASLRMEFEIFIRINDYLRDRGLQLRGAPDIQIKDVRYTYGDSSSIAPPEQRTPYVRPPITPPFNVLNEAGPIGAQGTAQPDQAAAPTEAKGAPSQASTHEVTPEPPPEGIPEEPPETPEPTRPRVPVRDIPEPTDTAHAAAPEAETEPEPKKPRRPRSAVRDLTRPTSE